MKPLDLFLFPLFTIVIYVSIVTKAFCYPDRILDEATIWLDKFRGPVLAGLL